MTNSQAQAYAELAMRKAGIPEEKIQEVLFLMWDLFDLFTEQEAEMKARY